MTQADLVADVESLGRSRQRSLKPYPSYKASGVEWLGRTPTNWTVKRLRFLLASPLQYGANESAELEDRSCPRYIRITDIDEGGALRDETFRSLPEEVARPYLLAYGDLLFARSGATVGKTFLYDDSWGRAAYAGYLIRARLDGDQLLPRFAAFFANSVQYWQWLNSSIIQATIQNVSADKYANLFVPLPPLPEQQAIAGFLDRETARIDELIGKKQRLIELLAEKRTALISHAVTKGLDPGAAMKDSGVEWLGQVPEHWHVLSLRRRWQVIDCKHRTVPFLDDGIPLASIGEVQGIELDLLNAKKTSDEEYRLLIENDRQPRRGDIIYSRNATVGAAAYVNTDETFCMGQDVCMIRSQHQNQRYLVYQLRSPSVMSQLDQIMVGATFKRVNVADIKALTVACPPIEEQKAIGVFCRERSAQFQVLIDTALLGISRLREYRSALISAAVTGKIDVRNEVEP